MSAENLFGTTADDGEVVDNPFIDLGTEDDCDNPFVNDAATAGTEKTEEGDSADGLLAFPERVAQEAPAESDNEDEADDSPADDASPLAATLEKQEKKENASIFALPPVFEYGPAKEDITDPELTFDELRKAKATDFTEFEEDGNRLSWSVSYGTIVKSVPTPKTTKIHEMKKEIERSKAFLDALKKAKDKSPRCIIKPTISAQKKGVLSSYKGIFSTLTAARASDKVISLFPASDGLVYERRCTEIGEFVTPAGDNVVDLEHVRAGFIPALPLLPHELVGRIIAFFRAVMAWEKTSDSEALVNVYWDKQAEGFLLDVPQQSVGKESVTARKSDLDSERYVHYMDVHSHNTMRAKFSAQDDRDERATRVYVVIGRLQNYFPDITARISNGGKYMRIPTEQVFERMPGGAFDPAWLNSVTFDEKLSIEDGEAA